MIDKKERKNGMGPVHSVARQKEWVLMSENQCTKKCNQSEIGCKKALPRQKEWARPDLNRSQWLPKPQGYQATPRAHRFGQIILEYKP